MVLRADPTGLTAAASTVTVASREAADAATGLRDGAARASGGCGPSPVAPALDRFAAAWGGELVAWALGSEQLGQIATENGRQLGATNGLSGPGS